MITTSRVQVMKTLFNTLDALSHQLVLQNLVDKLQLLSHRQHFKIDRIFMKIDIPDFLYNSYIAEMTKQLSDLLNNQQFWFIGNASARNAMIYDRVTGLLWDANPNTAQALTVADATQQLSQLTLGGLNHGWRLPTQQEITVFAKLNNNPLRKGSNCRLQNSCYWLCAGLKIDLDNFSVNGSGTGNVLACNRFACGVSAEEFIGIAINRQWSIRANNQQDSQDLLMALTQTPDLKIVYQDVDYLSARLPRLEPAQFTDPNKGLWEFWGLDANDLTEHRIRARNPADDVKDWNVAIDFGTSSTVVAYDDNGQSKLLRIGVKDFWEKEQPAHYENPTLLEFIDFVGLLNAWQTEAYRPFVQWDQVRSSHEALTRLRNNEADPKIVSSILTKLKQWALREGNQNRVRLTDQKSFEHQLAPLTQRLPVRGQPLTVSQTDSFDPIELYAWFLGLTINWRGRGIFLRYYMTFPVAYPKQVKENILASFQRGLQRSLPATLIKQPIFDRFTVEERASEPAAYAAIALRQLGIAPTVEGIAYAVFDFGGGTADFDFGYYRLPSAEEDDDGWEQVFEHVGAAGDRFLGGENLLENMAYLVFRHNLEQCRVKRIAFTRPLDADDFPGSELFLDQTQAAVTNTVMLMSKLRPLWEMDAPVNSKGIEKIAFLNRENTGETCEFIIPEAELKTYLETRIEEGVRNFLAALKKAFITTSPAQIHILLAGNASRSRWAGELFGCQRVPEKPVAERIKQPITVIVEPTADDSVKPTPFSRTQSYLAELFNGKAPELIVHPPLPISEEHPYQPTAKTGVALGLLNLCPGGVIKVVNRPAIEAEGEAPFVHYIGRERKGYFQVGINQGAVYGEWHELGAPRERVFNLYHTQSPRAHTGELQIGEAGLYKLRLDLAGDTTGKRVFGRAIAPNEIEVCTASARELITDDCDNLQQIKLD